MIDAIRSMTHGLAASTTPMDAFLSKEYAVYDWERVVIYTGSRIAEYGQSSSAMLPQSTKLLQPLSSKRYARVPMSQATGAWGGFPIALSPLILHSGTTACVKWTTQFALLKMPAAKLLRSIFVSDLTNQNTILPFASFGVYNLSNSISSSVSSRSFVVRAF